MSEPRNESWAAAMESGISTAIASPEPTSPITVEHIECRSTICEIAGYLPDTMGHSDVHPADILPEDIGAGWWQGRIDTGVGVHTYEGEPFARYIIIIADAEVFLNATE
ncbi:MAG: hypothetical protein QNJ11_11720 [Woeseiaceae bacterium]|nr:hypothetical protein [Woeseiaceae bacterium]